MPRVGSTVRGVDGLKDVSKMLSPRVGTSGQYDEYSPNAEDAIGGTVGMAAALVR